MHPVFDRQALVAFFAEFESRGGTEVLPRLFCASFTPPLSSGLPLGPIYRLGLILVPAWLANTMQDLTDRQLKLPLDLYKCSLYVLDG